MKHAYKALLALASLSFLAETCQAQDLGLTLDRMDAGQLDSLAALTARKIREAKLTEKEPAVLVIDFFRNSPGTPSQLGSILADHFSELLSSYAAGMKVLDRNILREYLHDNWTTLEDLRSNEACLLIARQLGATGVVEGSMVKTPDQIELTLHLEGFGSSENEDDLFARRDRTITFPLTEEWLTALYKPGANYERSADEIPKEPGVFIAGVNGATSPKCIYCPAPVYSDAARAARFQGTAVLSVLVDAEGHVSGIYVLKGAPFDLTGQAIKTTRDWLMEPGQKDGKPVPVRTSIEIGFRLFSGPDKN